MSYKKEYNINLKETEEDTQISFWVSKKLEEVKNDIKGMIPYYTKDKVKNIKITLEITD